MRLALWLGMLQRNILATAILQKGLGILLFKINYSYKLKILLMLKQAKKISKIVKERMEKLIQLY